MPRPRDAVDEAVRASARREGELRQFREWSLRAGTNITFDFKVTSQPWFTCEQCNSESEGKKRLILCVHCAKRCHDGHRGIKYLRTSKVACMCFECCDCILMKEVEQKAREEGIVPLNKLARYEAEEVKRRVRSRRPVVRHRGDSCPSQNERFWGRSDRFDGNAPRR